MDAPGPDLPPPPEQPAVDPWQPAAETAPTPPPRPASQRRGGGYVLAGGLLVVLGTFLPDVTVNGPGGSGSVSAWQAGAYGSLILGALAVARGLSMLRPGRFAFNLGTPLLGAGILAFLLYQRWQDVQNAITDVQLHPDATATIGIGLWLSVFGCALVAVGGLLDLASRRRA